MRQSAILFLSGMLTASLSAAPLPGGFDHSGWYEFEVVILINSEAEVLESQTWPLLPQPGYPSRWRWLMDKTTPPPESDMVKDARIHQSLSGHTMIYEPEIAPAPWLPTNALMTEDDLALINELIDLGLGSSREDREASLTPTESASSEQIEAPTSNPILPFEAYEAEAGPVPLLSLESLVLEGAPANLSQEVSVPFARPEQRAELLPIEVAAKSIPLPATFERLPLSKLAPGLERYRRSNNDEIIAATSWLQGPGNENLPIVIEPESSDRYPLAQGFIQLLPRANSWRLGLNIWANTQGQYLPDVFTMDPPPPSPPRTTIVPGHVTGSPQMSGTLSATSTTRLNDGTMIDKEYAQGGGANQRFEGTEQFGEGDLESGVAAVDSAPPPPDWNWRHVIHVADTVPLTENRLRYYDHPVIKVLAIWRELSWYELYLRGAMLREAEHARPAD